MLPVGTVTFLLTDVEGSTRLWQESSDRMGAAVLRHDAILAAAIERNGGVRPRDQGEGDSMLAAFARPSDALHAAREAQRALHGESWSTARGLRVRIAIHTGEAQLRDGVNYSGQAIIRCARLRALAHGGQVIVSGATRDLAVDQLGEEISLRFLGEYPLDDLARVEQVWQLVHPELPSDFPPLRASTRAVHHLPMSLSPFIGRRHEIDTLTGLVRTERIVTVTGSGGAGKSRLAERVGSALLDEFDGGVRWVELASLRGEAVEGAVRAAFGIGDTAALSTEEALRRSLEGRRALLIADNCEHVVDPVRAIVDRMLRACSSLHVLATSRSMLDLPGELAWRVPPLSLPDPTGTPIASSLAGSDAVELFCDRARRARPNFKLNDKNAPAIAGLCHRLDGIPLAIELAAARCRVLSPQQILGALDDAFRVLAGGSPTLLPRQQTLEASIAWSHDLLTENQRVLFRRLAVFVGGWTLDAAEVVCADDTLPTFEVLDALDRLVDHSLIVVDEAGGGSRFRMLETVRQFAQQRLAFDPDESRAVCERHASWFADHLAALDADLRGWGIDKVLPGLIADLENIEAAFLHALAEGREDAASTLLWAVYRIVMVSKQVGILGRCADATTSKASMHSRLFADGLWLRAVDDIGRGRVADCARNAAAALEHARSSGHDVTASRSLYLILILRSTTGAPGSRRAGGARGAIDRARGPRLGRAHARRRRGRSRAPGQSARGAATRGAHGRDPRAARHSDRGDRSPGRAFADRASWR